MKKKPSRFTEKDIYEMLDRMAEKYPNNKHLQVTCRDMLQQLRDEGLLSDRDE